MNYDRIDCIVIKYKNNPSRAKTKRKYGLFTCSTFHEVSVTDIKIIIKELKSDQASNVYQLKYTDDLTFHTRH